MGVLTIVGTRDRSTVGNTVPKDPSVLRYSGRMVGITVGTTVICTDGVVERCFFDSQTVPKIVCTVSGTENDKTWIGMTQKISHRRNKESRYISIPRIRQGENDQNYSCCYRQEKVMNEDNASRNNPELDPCPVEGEIP